MQHRTHSRQMSGFAAARVSGVQSDGGPRAPLLVAFLVPQRIHSTARPWDRGGSQHAGETQCFRMTL